MKQEQRLLLKYSTKEAMMYLQLPVIHIGIIDLHAEKVFSFIYFVLPYSEFAIIYVMPLFWTIIYLF